MRRWIWGLGSLLVLFLAAVFVLPRLVPEDLLRDRVVGELERRLERPVRIERIGLGLRPMPTVRASGIEIGRAAGSEQELSVRSLDLAVALRPLFRREIEVVRATIDGLVIDIHLDATDAGEPPPDSSGADGAVPREAAGGGSGTPAGLTVRIESLRLSDATVRVWKGDGQIFEILSATEELQAEFVADGSLRMVGVSTVPEWRLYTPTGELGRDLPARLEKTLQFDPAGGVLRVERASLDLAGLPVSVEGQIDGIGSDAPEVDLSFAGGPGGIESILGVLPSAWIAAGPDFRTSGRLQVEGHARGPVGPGRQPDFSLQVSLADGRLSGGSLPLPIEALTASLLVDPQRIAVQSVSARSGSSKLEAKGTIDGYSEIPKVEIAVDGDVDLALASALQEGEGLPVLTGRAVFQGVVRGSLPPEADPAETLEPVATITLTDAAVTGIERPIEGLGGRLVLRGTELRASDLRFRIEGSDFVVDGTVGDYRALEPDAPADLVTSSDLGIRSTRLDLDAFAPPAGETDGGTGGAAAGGGAPSGPSGGKGSAPNAGGAPADQGFAEFARLLSRLEGPIRIQADQVRARELDWKEVRGTGRIDRGRIRIDALALQVFGGALSTHGSVDLRDPVRPTFDLDLRAQGLQAARFFTENPSLSKLSGLGGFVQGALDLTAKADGAIDETFQLDLQTLTSVGDLKLVDGQLSGHPVQSALATYLGQADLRTLPIRDWLQPFRIRNGRVEFEKVIIQSGDISLSGSGWTSIDGQVRLDADVLLPAGRVASLRQALPREVALVLLGDEGQPAIVPIQVSGPTVKPAVQIDMSRLTDRARDRARSEIEAEKAKLEAQARAEKEKLERRLAEEAKTRAGKLVGGVVGGASEDSTAARPDTTAREIENEVRGLIKGIFKRK